jgi:hypothetical protein
MRFWLDEELALENDERRRGNHHHALASRGGATKAGLAALAPTFLIVSIAIAAGDVGR